MTKIKEILEELKTAEYVGEDGDMVVNAKDEEEALAKFRERWIEDCGEEDWNDIEYTLENVGVCWLHLTNDEEKLEMDDSEWYVSYVKPSKYQLFVLRG